MSGLWRTLIVCKHVQFSSVSPSMLGLAFLEIYHFIGLYLLPNPLDGRVYLILQQVLPELLDAAHVLPSLRRYLWYQNASAPPHYGIHVSGKHLNITFGQLGDRWPGSMPCQITGPIMHGLLLGSHEEFVVRNALSFQWKTSWLEYL
ncbi:hypothetical protein TNCV_1577981 [Trichonephila clavipes]|nr:hypothetical protein TNCV_1577981 [Trichonephila clavipes]